MSKFIACLVAALLVGCVKDPYAAPANYVQDDLYCWHREADGKWHVRGFNHECPANARYAEPWE